MQLAKGRHNTIFRDSLIQRTLVVKRLEADEIYLNGRSITINDVVEPSTLVGWKILSQNGVMSWTNAVIAQRAYLVPYPNISTQIRTKLGVLSMYCPNVITDRFSLENPDNSNDAVKSFTRVKSTPAMILGDNVNQPITCQAYTASGSTAVIAASDSSGHHLLSPSGATVHAYLQANHNLATHWSSATSDVQLGHASGAANSSATSATTSRTAVGHQSAQTNNAEGTTAIGALAGNSSQDAQAVAIGYNAGNANQSFGAIGIGALAGHTSQGTAGIGVGYNAASNNQGYHGVAIGVNSGQYQQGANAVAIGSAAGQWQQHANSICLNSSGGAYNTSGTGFFVKATSSFVNSRQESTPGYWTNGLPANVQVLGIDTTTGEIVRIVP
jgi:hypothetical protein